MKKQFGLIGYPLSHSFSLQYFTDKFYNEGLDGCEFINLELKSLEGLHELIRQYPQLKGLAVTIPHKQSVVSLLKKTDGIVETVGACNCIRIINYDLYGFNTDVGGFERSFIPLLRPHQTKALILGRGGAAMAVSYVLDKLSIEHLFIERNARDMKSRTYNEISGRFLHDYHIIINTTPVGTFPNTDSCPQIPYDAVTAYHYLFDLIYNPEKTMFLKKGEEMGATIKNGYEMLVIQAEENWRIWNDV